MSVNVLREGESHYLYWYNYREFESVLIRYVSDDRLLANIMDEYVYQQSAAKKNSTALPRRFRRLVVKRKCLVYQLQCVAKLSDNVEEVEAIVVVQSTNLIIVFELCLRMIVMQRPVSADPKPPHRD